MSLPRIAATVGGLLFAGLALVFVWSGTASADQSALPPEACTFCHSTDRLAPQVTPKAQRTWQQEQGTGFGEWSKGKDDRAFKRTDLPGWDPSPAVPLAEERGVHSRNDLYTCTDCHKEVTDTDQGWCDKCHDAFAGRTKWQHAWKPNSPTYPPGTNLTSGNCAANCHAWVPAGATVTADGFENLLANPSTTYRGPIQPGEVLANGTKLHSTEIFPNDGCAGFCHGGPTAKHGTITLCKDCHNYSFGETTANPTELNMHVTHIPFVGAEQAVVDPANQGAGPCIYCHSVEETPGRASCWNCHLSGHDPNTPYWEAPSPNTGQSPSLPARQLTR